MLQVLVGTILVASKDYVAPRFHMFYGFVAFLTVGHRCTSTVARCAAAARCSTGWSACS